MQCLNCTKNISDKSKYCSDKCRKAYTRRTKKGAQPGQNDPDIATRTLDFKLTRTDRLFEKYKPNYYQFGERIYQRICLQCQARFKTRMQLLKFCSPEHQIEVLDQLTGKSSK